MSTDDVRVKRLHAAIELLASGAFDEAQAHLDDTTNDLLGETVRVLHHFAGDLNRELQTKEQVLADLQISQADLEEALVTVRRQQSAIQELGTPIVDVWEDIIALPIIGVIDTQRALSMTQKLLERIQRDQAKCAIIDLTGVDVIDSKTVEYLVNMTRAANLLGSYCVITGINPEIAQTLVQLGVELGSVRTLRSLKEGLRACFARLHEIEQRAKLAIPMIMKTST